MEKTRVHDCSTSEIIDRVRTPDEQEAVEIARSQKPSRAALRSAAMRAINASVIQGALDDPNAPPEVKAYKAELEGD